jgi:hypothetical protein
VFKPFVDKIRKRAAVIAKTEELGNDAYFRLGGEQNANLAEHRVEMGPEARAIVPPATPLQTGGGMLHRRRNFYPAKDEYNLDAPGGGQKIQGAVVAALRAYAKDPTGHKAYYNRVIKGYGWDDMPAAAKSYKFTPDEHAELKSYIDTHLPKELKPYREYIEGLSMQNTEDWKPYSGPGSNWSEWADTRLTAAKGTFLGIVDDAGSMLKDFGYKSPEPKGWSSGQLGMDAPGSPMKQVRPLPVTDELAARRPSEYLKKPGSWELAMRDADIAAQRYLDWGRNAGIPTSSFEGGIRTNPLREGELEKRMFGSGLNYLKMKQEYEQLLREHQTKEFNSLSQNRK